MNKYFLLVVILAVGIRLLLSFLYAPQLKSGQYIHFQTTLLSEPVSHGSFDTVTVQYSNGFSSVPLSLAIPAGSTLHYGQTVSLSGKIKYKVLKNTKTITTISPLRIKIDPAQKNTLLVVSAFLRQKLQSFYEKYFSPRWAALMLGIVLGIKVNFPKDFLVQLQQTGVVHVIAAEGLNVIIVSQFLLSLLMVFLKRQWAIALTIIGLLFYAFLCGLQPSIVRSTIMIGFAFLAQLVGRQYTSLYGLVLAGAGMLLYDPAWLFDVGFQLSFAATAGILFLKPLLPRWGLLSEDINTTLAAQLATLPILLTSFGSYGLLSIVANALILWTIPPLMILGGVGGLVGIAVEPIGGFFLFLSLPLLFFFDKVISFFASFPWQLSLSEMPPAMIVGYYLVVLSILLLLKRKAKAT